MVHHNAHNPVVYHMTSGSITYKSGPLPGSGPVHEPVCPCPEGGHAICHEGELPGREPLGHHVATHAVLYAGIPRGNLRRKGHEAGLRPDVGVEHGHHVRTVPGNRSQGNVHGLVSEPCRRIEIPELHAKYLIAYLLKVRLHVCPGVLGAQYDVSPCLTYKAVRGGFPGTEHGPQYLCLHETLLHLTALPGMDCA